MGYTTDFSGEFSLDKPLKPEHKAYLERFARSRRMPRDPKIAEKFPDPLRLAVGLPIGPQGAYYVSTDALDGPITDPNDPRMPDASKLPENQRWQVAEAASHQCAGQRHDASVLNYNSQPNGQPGLWCQWVPNEDGTAIEWDGGEKFYEYTAWIQYLIEHFLKPWGYKLNGEVEWQGEESRDMGKIIVKNNKVTTKVAHITYR